jgi:hypothetical protein
VLDKVTGRPLDPQHTLELLQRHSLPHVPMSLHPIRELSPVVAAIRADSTAEGAVLYINNARGEVIGLLKVKVRRVPLAPDGPRAPLAVCFSLHACAPSAQGRLRG